MAVPNRPRDDRIIDLQTGRMNPVWRKWFEYLSDMIDTVDVNGAKKFGIKEDRLPGNALTTDDLGVVVVTPDQLSASTTSVDMDTIQDGALYKKPAATDIGANGRIKRVRVAHSGLSTGEYEGMIATATIDSSQTVVLGTLLVRASDGELEVLDLTKQLTTTEIFMSLGTGKGSQPVLCSGSTVKNTSWSWTAGKKLWASNTTPGAMTQTDPSASEFLTKFCVGHAISADTIHFERASSPTTDAQEEIFYSVLTASDHFHKIVVHGSYLYAITGAGNKIYRTSDGVTWTDVSFTGMTAHTVNDSISDGTYLYLAGSFTVSGAPKYGVMRSSDGVDYALVLDIGSAYVPRSIYKGATYYFVGTDTGGGLGNPQVFQSEDGESWSSIYSGSANIVSIRAFLEYGGYLYAATEYTGSAARLIYSSTDGATWNFSAATTLNDDDGTAFEWIIGDGSRFLTGGQDAGMWSWELDPTTAIIGWVQVYTDPASKAILRTMTGTSRIYFGHTEVYYTLDHSRVYAIDGPADKFYVASLCEFGGALYMASQQTGQYKVWKLSKSLTLTAH